VVGLGSRAAAAGGAHDSTSPTSATSATSPSDTLADRLDAATDLLVTEYGRALAGSLVVFAANAAAREQAQSQMRLVLGDVAHGLRGESARSSEDLAGLTLSHEIGLDRARAHVDPLDSIAAARVLSQVVVHWAVQESANDDAGTMGDLLAELSASLVFRITEATTWYATYLFNRVVHAQRDERRRLARDLHDQVGYGVVAARLGLEAYQRAEVGRAETGGADDAGAVIAQTIGRLDTAIDMINKLIGDLRAEVTDLTLALKGLAQEGSDPSVAIACEVNGDESWLPSTVRTEAFLIVQEAVRNALRHSGARHISVVVHVMPFWVTATVDDDGRGLQTPVAGESGGMAGGHGVAGMFERAALLGGSLTAADRPVGGVRVSLGVPLTLDPFAEAAEDP